MQEIVAAGVPSLAAAAIEDGRLVWLHAEGWADVEAGARATPDTIYRIGSVSKAITATAVMLAVESNAIDLEQPLCVRPMIAPRQRCGAITLADAINMTGGMPQAVSYPGIAPNGPVLTDDQFIDRYSFSITGASPHYAYSNMGPALAARAVEQALREPFPAYERRVLLAPLGMSSTYWAMRDAPSAARAVSYNRHRRQFEHSYETLPHAGAGMVSSARDLSSFALAHLGNMSAVLDETELQTLHTPATQGFYGFGWGRISHREWTLLVSDGEVNGGQAIIIIAPSRRAGAVVLSNAANDDINELALTLIDVAAPGAAAAFAQGVEHIENRLAQVAPSEVFAGAWSLRGQLYADGRRLHLTISADDSRTLDIRLGTQRLRPTLIDPANGYTRWSLACPSALPTCTPDAEAILELTATPRGVAGAITITSLHGASPYGLHADCNTLSCSGWRGRPQH
jgi:CubicO group peptidase (beta-lactamase class C family)